MHLVPVSLLKRTKMMKTCWNMHDLDRCVTALLSEHSSHLNPLETARVPRGGDNWHSPVHQILFLNYIHIVELFLLPGMRNTSQVRIRPSRKHSWWIPTVRGVAHGTVTTVLTVPLFAPDTRESTKYTDLGSKIPKFSAQPTLPHESIVLQMADRTTLKNIPTPLTVV